MISAKASCTNLSLTSDDELILAPRFDMQFSIPSKHWSASAVADSKGNVYLGTGHDGKIFKVDADGQRRGAGGLFQNSTFWRSPWTAKTCSMPAPRRTARCTRSKTARRKNSSIQRRNTFGRWFSISKGVCLSELAIRGLSIA